MSYTQRQLVQECFGGDCDRQCSYCEAHHSRAGICCFGHKYDCDDEECRACIHEYSCSREYESLIEEQQPRRRVVVNAVRPRPTPGYNSPRPVYANGPRHQRAVVPYRHSDSMGRLLEQFPQEPRMPMEWKDETNFFGQLSTVVGWGMVEGGLELALDFFRRRRPG